MNILNIGFISFYYLCLFIGCSWGSDWQVHTCPCGQQQGAHDPCHQGKTDVCDQGIWNGQGHPALSGSGHPRQPHEQGRPGVRGLHPLYWVWGESRDRLIDMVAGLLAIISENNCSEAKHNNLNVASIFLLSSRLIWHLLAVWACWILPGQRWQPLLDSAVSQASE